MTDGYGYGAASDAIFDFLEDPNVWDWQERADGFFRRVPCRDDVCFIRVRDRRLRLIMNGQEVAHAEDDKQWATDRDALAAGDRLWAHLVPAWEALRTN